MDRPPFIRRGLVRGMIDIWPLALSAFAYGVAFGALASQAGLSRFAAVLMSALVFGGSAQMVSLQVWADPVPFFAVWMATMARGRSAAYRRSYEAIDAVCCGGWTHRRPGRGAAIGVADAADQPA